MTQLAVVRVRGSIGALHDVKETLALLRLYRKNYCVLVNDSPTAKGMLEKVKDFVTWGAISEETALLLQERKEGEKKFFRLHPPRGGFERKGIKVPYTKGGVLGNRKEIDALIRRMLP